MIHVLGAHHHTGQDVHVHVRSCTMYITTKKDPLQLVFNCNYQVTLQPLLKILMVSDDCDMPFPESKFNCKKK